MPLSTPQNDADNALATSVNVTNGFIPVSQSGTWTTGRTWALTNGTDSIAAVQSGTWNVGRTWALASGIDSVASVQSGAWVTGRTWTLASGTDSIAAIQSGSWTVGGTGNFTVVQSAGTNLHTVVDSGSVSISGTPNVTVTNAGGASAVNIQDGGNSITIDGTVSTSGTYNATAPNLANGGSSALQLDQSGSLYVNTEGRRASYKAAATFTLAASSTDVFTIYGSATKTVRVQEVFVTGTNTGNTNALVAVIKRSTANTGGTSTVATNVSLDSTNAAGTATVRAYTVNPTLGTTVGTLDSRYIFLPALASTNPVGNAEFDYGDDNEQACTLRGTGEGIVLNMNVGGLLPGVTVLSAVVTWTEE